MSLTISAFTGGVTEVAPSQSLIDTSNYLYSLCGKYSSFARNLIAEGGSVAPITPNRDPNPKPLDFVVTSSSPIVDGNNTITIPSFVGYNLIFIRNNIPQSTVDNGGSYYSWNSTTGVFICFGDAIASELFQLIPTI